MFRSAFPIISTPNLPRALGFYHDLLDGTISYQFPPEGEPQYVGVELGTSHVGIGQDVTLPDDTADQRFSMWIYADDCDAAIERLRRGGVSIIEEPTDQPWGERVARVEDPDGNAVIIGAPGQT